MVLTLISNNAMSAEFTGTGKRTAPATTGVNREAKKGKKASEKDGASALVTLAAAGPTYSEESTLTMQPTAETIQTTINQKVDVVAKDAAYWKVKFEELQELKVVGANESYKALKEQTKDQIKTYKATISFLESKLGLKASEIASTDDLLMAERKVAKQERILEFYEKLTSTTIQYNREKKAFQCMAMNPENKKGVQFSVRKTKAGDNKFKAMANSKYLPEFLRAEEGAVFDDSQFPFLLKEIYNTDMFKEE
ncbi:hypothetical protein TrCOL_g5265 [Triparma columacea]|uniref:Uncharacterized protein n=1 Tax=Triparma columacea TaxID=722753 RepID=A0A9W7GFU2_9STRA|nr:hypothetical protein TrCOL_g5265 [Triparma columacea]